MAYLNSANLVHQRQEIFRPTHRYINTDTWTPTIESPKYSAKFSTRQSTDYSLPFSSVKEKTQQPFLTIKGFPLPLGFFLLFVENSLAAISAPSSKHIVVSSGRSSSFYVEAQLTPRANIIYFHNH
jgi:hypothetical protein